MRALQRETVEDVDDAACAVVESKWRRELLAFTKARRVDEDHLVLGAEVIGLRRPHVARHQQARPEHHRLAAAADLNPHRAQHGVEPVLFHQPEASAPHVVRATILVGPGW